MPKTGTTTFHELMLKVQIKSVHDSSKVPITEKGLWESYSGSITDQYERLYTNHTDAKFVLTIRNEQHWLKSAKKWYSPLTRSDYGKVGFRERIFGTKYVSTLDDKELLKYYNCWNNKVKEFFGDKDNFMEINFINYFGDSKQLCRRLLKFLEIDTSDLLFPNELDFPHENKNIRTSKESLLPR